MSRDYDVVWSAALERAGKAPGLSTYTGGSMLLGAVDERDGLDYGDCAPVKNPHPFKGRPLPRREKK